MRIRRQLYSSIRVLCWAACCGQLALMASAAAQTGADREGAIVVFPYVELNSASSVDTRLMLSNAGSSAIGVSCFYENAALGCLNSGQLCASDLDCPDEAGPCQQQYEVSEFVLTIPAGQPIVWFAGEGLSGQIPPLSSDPFVGSLRCVGVDPESLEPVAASLEGGAVIVSANQVSGHEDLASYNAHAFEFFWGDGDNVLSLGGWYDEYSGCRSEGSFGHPFQGAVDPITGADQMRTKLVLLSCSADYVLDQPTEIVVHFNIYNELAQRVGTSKRLSAQLAADLSEIHPTAFEYGTQGTLTGRTSVQATSDGFIGVVIESHERDGGPRFSAARPLHFRARFAANEGAIVLPSRE